MSSIILYSTLVALFFLGGWFHPFFLLYWLQPIVVIIMSCLFILLFVRSIDFFQFYYSHFILLLVSSFYLFRLSLVNSFFRWLEFLSLLPNTIITLLSNTLWLSFKTTLALLLFLLVRAALPRFRFDQLNRLGWRVLLPLSLAFSFFYSSFATIFDIYPHDCSTHSLSF